MANVPLKSIKFPGLPDTYIIPQVDNTLTQQGRPADAQKTGNEITALKQDLSEKGLSEDAKVALLNCFSHVAWIDEYGQDYYDALEDALYPDSGLTSITATFTQGSVVVYPTTPINDLKAYLVVTGHYSDGTSKTVIDYSLSGTLEVGTSTITVTKEGKTTTFDVTVTAPYWDYEWYASSGVLPEEMTADYYDFTTEEGSLFVKHPNLDFNYIGDCIIEIDCKVICANNSGVEFYRGNNPQVLILNEDMGNNSFRGIKVIFNSSLVQNPTYSNTAVGINGVNALINGKNASGDYHIYKISAEDNVYSLMIDDEQITLTQNTGSTQYLDRTGIASAVEENGFYGMFIRSIKFKRI